MLKQMLKILLVTILNIFSQKYFKIIHKMLGCPFKFPSTHCFPLTQKGVIFYVSRYRLCSLKAAERLFPLETNVRDLTAICTGHAPCSLWRLG